MRSSSAGRRRITMRSSWLPLSDGLAVGAGDRCRRRSWRLRRSTSGSARRRARAMKARLPAVARERGDGEWVGWIAPGSRRAFADSGGNDSSHAHDEKEAEDAEDECRGDGPSSGSRAATAGTGTEAVALPALPAISKRTCQEPPAIIHSGRCRKRDRRQSASWRRRWADASTLRR